MIQFFTLVYSPELNNFDDRELQRFLSVHEICSIKNHFFVLEDKPYWAIAVQYKPAESISIHSSHAAVPSMQPVANLQNSKSDPSKHDKYIQNFSDTEKKLYHALREWRNATAKKLGYNPFIIFSNEQIALLVQKMPTNLAALDEIPGIGRGKIEKYGQALLECIQNFLAKNPITKATPAAHEEAPAAHETVCRDDIPLATVLPAEEVTANRTDIPNVNADSNEKQ